MSIPRSRTLQQWSNARAVQAHPGIPQNIKDLAKKVEEHTEVALGLQDALERKQAREAMLREQVRALQAEALTGLPWRRGRHRPPE
jgi:hypothetical protein